MSGMSPWEIVQAPGTVLGASVSAWWGMKENVLASGAVMMLTKAERQHLKQPPRSEW